MAVVVQFQCWFLCIAKLKRISFKQFLYVHVIHTLNFIPKKFWSHIFMDISSYNSNWILVSPILQALESIPHTQASTTLYKLSNNSGFEIVHGIETLVHQKFRQHS